MTPIWKGQPGGGPQIMDAAAGASIARSRGVWTLRRHERSWIGSLLLLLLPCLAGYAKAERLERRFVDGTLLLEFDPAQIEKSDLNEYLVVHPIAYESQFRFANPIWQCIEGDPRYLPCGTRDFRDPHFLVNAEENLRQSRLRLAQLRRLTAYRELDSLVEYFAASLRFEIWKGERLLHYYREWDEEALEQDYGELRVIRATNSTLENLRHSEDRAYKWELSRGKWGNIVNGLYRKHEKGIPKKVWHDFIKARGITEQVTFDEIE